VSTGLHSPYPIGDVGKCRHQKNRDILGRLSTAQDTAHLEAVAARHLDVENHQIWLALRHLGQRIVPISGGGDGVVKSAQIGASEREVSWLVVCNEDGCLLRTLAHIFPQFTRRGRRRAGLQNSEECCSVCNSTIQRDISRLRILGAGAWECTWPDSRVFAVRSQGTGMSAFWQQGRRTVRSVR